MSVLDWLLKPGVRHVTLSLAILVVFVWREGAVMVPTLELLAVRAGELAKGVVLTCPDSEILHVLVT